MDDTSTSVVGSTFNPYVVIGPVVLGALVNACLFGGLVIQTYVYYANFPKDHRSIKILVAAVFAIQIAHLICVSATLWSMAVSTYGDPSKLQVFPSGADAAILFTSLTGALVELYFAFRLWKLSKSLPLPLFSFALCLVSQCLSLVITVKAFAMTSVSAFAVDQNAIIMASLTSRVVYELTTAMGLAWYLRKQRLMTFTRTTGVIDRLVLWTIETGLITSLVAISVMTFFIAMKESYIWVGLYAFIANINSNSLLASLNGRLALRNTAKEGLRMQTLTNSGEGHRHSQSVVINVTRTIDIHPQKCDELV